MCGCVSKNLGFSSSMKMEEEKALFTKKQGIVSVLGSDSEKSSNLSDTSALRRTLSADMSSKKWLSENGLLSSTKKISSPAEFSISEINSSSSSSEEEDGEGENESKSTFDIWTSIQEQKKKKKMIENNEKFDAWSSILSPKVLEDSKALPPPYVHPLTKRSSSSLSKKSLEICTESLGSETGSEGFSSYPPSEAGDVNEDNEEDNNTQDQQEQQQDKEERLLTRQEEQIRAAKYNYLDGKKSSQRSFPPPIPSLSRQDGASMHMKTLRDNGRLVLEAVSVYSQKNFCAQRQDGRLVLTFANSSDNEQEEDKNQEKSDEREEKNELGELEEDIEAADDVEEDEEEKEMSFVVEKAPRFSSGLIRFHRLALVVNNKPTRLANRNPAWPKKFNETVKLKGKELEERDEKVVVVEKAKQPNSLLPPRPPAPSSTVASFNAYEYYWRPKATSKDYLFNKNKVVITKNGVEEEHQQQFVVLRRNKGEGGADELVPLMLKRCKEQRRSFLFWEPYCIATS